MAQLRIYTVHIRPDIPAPYEKAEFVKEGFSTQAFLFTFFWTLYKRLWWPSAVIIAFFVLCGIGLEQEWLSPTGFSIVQLGAQGIFAYLANDWLRARLKREGYIIADIVSGDNMLRAEQRFFDRFAATSAATPSAYHPI